MMKKWLTGPASEFPMLLAVVCMFCSPTTVPFFPPYLLIYVHLYMFGVVFLFFSFVSLVFGTP